VHVEQEQDSSLQPARERQKGRRKGSYLPSPEEMKDKVRKGLLEPVYNVADFYKTTGIWQKIARHPLFDSITLGVIALNALWIGIDTDFNHAETILQAKPIFQIADNFFCSYFFFEWLVRFNAFRRKRDGFRDTWFAFDSCLVFLMVFETWVMTAFTLVSGGASAAGGGMGNASILRLFRLLRLSRMTRMVRLLRRMPELVILVKSMVAAIRSLVFTFCLLFVMLYIFGMTFRQLANQSLAEAYFSSLPHAMYTLLIHGTFLDSLSTVVEVIASQSRICALIFWVFVVLSSLTVMNMLIGILCEVVSAVSATDREAMLVTFVKEKMRHFLRELDENKNEQISASELLLVLEKPEACRLLQDVGVDVVGLIDQIDIIFADDTMTDESGSVEMDFPRLVELILSQRNSCTATVKDVIDLRKFIRAQVGTTNKSIERIEQRLESVPEVLGGSPRGAAAQSLAAPADPAPSTDRLGEAPLATVGAGDLAEAEGRLRRKTEGMRVIMAELVGELDAELAEVRSLRARLEGSSPAEAEQATVSGDAPAEPRGSPDPLPRDA